MQNVRLCQAFGILFQPFVIGTGGAFKKAQHVRVFIGHERFGKDAFAHEGFVDILCDVLIADGDLVFPGFFLFAPRLDRVAEFLLEAFAVFHRHVFGQFGFDRFGKFRWLARVIVGIARKLGHEVFELLFLFADQFLLVARHPLFHQVGVVHVVQFIVGIALTIKDFHRAAVAKILFAHAHFDGHECGANALFISL